MAEASLAHALSSLIYMIEKGENVTIVKMKASQTKDGVRAKNPALDYKEFWTSSCAYPMTEEEKQNKKFFNDIERELFFNYRTIFIHNGKENRYGVASKRPLKTGEKNYFQPQWKPIDGEQFYIQSFDPLIDCYEIVVRSGQPQDEDQKEIANRYVLNYMDEGESMWIDIHKANDQSVWLGIHNVIKGKPIDPLYRQVWEFVKKSNRIKELKLEFIEDPEVREALRSELLRGQMEGKDFGIYDCKKRDFYHVAEGILDVQANQNRAAEA